jgi:cytochrome bd-type quinol oxidase subunit 1
MFTFSFWIVFAIGLLVSLGVSIYYGRRAIHPRLRPHFGQVLVVFLVLAMISFFVAIVLGKLIGGGMEKFDPKKIEENRRGYSAPAAPAPRSPAPAEGGR